MVTFPVHNKELCDKWVRANPRKDYVPSDHSKICSLHFRPDDFIEEHKDSNKQRLKTFAEDKLMKRRLKEGAVPSIFPNAPDRLSKPAAAPRTTVKATPSSRLEHEAMEMSRMEESFMAEDDVSKLTVIELADRLRAEATAPQGFMTAVVGETLLIHAAVGN